MSIDMGYLVVHEAGPGGPVTIATRLVGDRTTAENTAATMQANSDGTGHYLAVHAVAEDDLRECPDYYAPLAALNGTGRAPSLHPGADATGVWDVAPLRELRDLAGGPRHALSATPQDIDVFASAFGTVHTGPDGGEAA